MMDNLFQADHDHTQSRHTQICSDAIVKHLHVPHKVL